MTTSLYILIFFIYYKLDNLKIKKGIIDLI